MINRRRLDQNRNPICPKSLKLLIILKNMILDKMIDIIRRADITLELLKKAGFSEFLFAINSPAINA
jgi:hypothetical protein